MTVEVNVGVTADTVRAELVSLATVLNAGVKNPHVYCNANGTATSDFIQVSATEHVEVVGAHDSLDRSHRTAVRSRSRGTHVQFGLPDQDNHRVRSWSVDVCNWSSLRRERWEKWLGSSQNSFGLQDGIWVSQTHSRWLECIHFTKICHC